MAIDLPWHLSTPKQEGLHLVAIKLGNNSGYYAFSYWNGSEWDQTFPENVIACYPVNELLTKIDIKWPEPDVEEEQDDLPATGIVDDWQEVL